ncbi:MULTISPECIES: LysR family transcriptional regulator [unclassified Burkholderia]|uniref:LysR family transcriptional regulator n=1 Tax=unclassified Burkholderia TaxID=2613784 RepID=UPI002AAF3FF9|nr:MULTISPECIES: LysR family transcriptional regulator [unclassified Burkholderia]
MKSDIDLRLLRLLVQVHALGSVSKAAEAIQLSQPAASLALGRLRRILGDPLFVRGTAGMLPTPRCDEVATTARHALSMIDRAVHVPAPFDPMTARRDFVVTLSDIGEMVFLPKLMAHLSQKAPHCNLRSKALSVDELPYILEGGEVEMAIGFFPDLERPGFFMQTLFEHRFVCLVRKDHPRVTGDRIPSSDFLDLPHAVVEPEGRSHELFENLLKKNGLKRRVQLSIPHYMSVPAIVAATDMIATVPTVVAEYFVQFGNLRIVLPPINTQPYALKQHWHERFNTDPALKWLRGEISVIFSDLHFENHA